MELRDQWLLGLLARCRSDDRGDVFRRHYEEFVSPFAREIGFALVGCRTDLLPPGAKCSPIHEAVAAARRLAELALQPLPSEVERVCDSPTAEAEQKLKRAESQSHEDEVGEHLKLISSKRVNSYLRGVPAGESL
jgi:hypothetical protein